MVDGRSGSRSEEVDREVVDGDDVAAVLKHSRRGRDEADRRVGGERSGQVESHGCAFPPSPVIRSSSTKLTTRRWRTGPKRTRRSRDCPGWPVKLRRAVGCTGQVEVTRDRRAVAVPRTAARRSRSGRSVRFDAGVGCRRRRSRPSSESRPPCRPIPRSSPG